VQYLQIDGVDVSHAMHENIIELLRGKREVRLVLQDVDEEPEEYNSDDGMLAAADTTRTVGHRVQQAWQPTWRTHAQPHRLDDAVIDYFDQGGRSGSGSQAAHR
jgi:hypothetical protein